MAASESSTEPTTSQPAASSAQICQSLLNKQLATTLKRKATDQNLEIITIDPHYDFTLIVGTLEHEHGQRALRVNRGSMRNVSDIWTKMLTGNWTERKKPEIELPDDSWEGLLLVLRMAHSQFAQLPDALSAGELWALAVLTDKYNLMEVVQIMLELKKWLVPYRTEWVKWPSHFHLQDFTEMTLIFGLDTDYEYLVHRLAVEERAKLRSSLPDRVLIRINEVRTSVLQEWIICCANAFEMALRGQTDAINPSNPSCPKELCSVARCGILVRGIFDAGIDTHLGSPSTMYQSVASYWKSLKSIGAEFKTYSPYGTTYPHRRAHNSTCRFETCFGDFGMLNKATAVLQQYTYEEVFAHLQNVRQMPPRDSDAAEPARMNTWKR